MVKKKKKKKKKTNVSPCLILLLLSDWCFFKIRKGVASLTFDILHVPILPCDISNDWEKPRLKRRL